MERARAIHFFQRGLHPCHELPRGLAILRVPALESLAHLCQSSGSLGTTRNHILFPQLDHVAVTFFVAGLTLRSHGLGSSRLRQIVA